MFLHTDPHAQLDLYRQRSAELIRQATEYRRARGASNDRGRHRRFRRRHD